MAISTSASVGSNRIASFNSSRSAASLVVAVLAGAIVMQAGGQAFGLRQDKPARIVVVQLGVELADAALALHRLYQRLQRSAASSCFS